MDQRSFRRSTCQITVKFARQRAITLGEFLAEYRKDRKVKASTLKVYDKVIRNLCEHYKKDCLISTIGPTEAEGFRTYPQSPDATDREKLLSTSTINRRVTYAKQFFNAAKKKGFALGVKPSDFVIAKPHYRHPDANLRQQFLKLAKVAGITPWAKTFQNLRASRETERIERIGLRSLRDHRQLRDRRVAALPDAPSAVHRVSRDSRSRG